MVRHSPPPQPPPCFLLQSMFLHVSFSFSAHSCSDGSALAKMKYAHRGDGGEVAWAVRGMFYRYFLVVGLFFHPAWRKKREKAELVSRQTKYEAHESSFSFLQNLHCSTWASKWPVKWENLAKLMFSSSHDLFQLSRAIQALMSLFHLLQCICTFI